VTSTFLSSFSIHSPKRRSFSNYFFFEKSSRGRKSGADSRGKIQGLKKKKKANSDSRIKTKETYGIKKIEIQLL
jgi:hypothetical protein